MKLPKLNLRDLFWLVVVVAMSLGWWLERTRLTAHLAATAEELSTTTKALTRSQSAVKGFTREFEGEGWTVWENGNVVILFPPKPGFKSNHLGSRAFNLTP